MAHPARPALEQSSRSGDRLAATLTSAPLVGRERECEQLYGLLARAWAGRGASLVICGAPGVGKTALLGDLRRHAHDWLVLSTQGVESETNLAFAGLAQVLHPVLELRASLPSPRRAALESALGLGAPRPGDRFATYAAALGLLAEAAERAPVLVAIDDAHWLDAASLESLRFCARRIGHDRIALVFCSREAAPEDVDSTGAPELRLSGLGAEAAARLLQRHAPVPVAQPVIAALQSATLGNPLALVELPRLLDGAQLRGTQPLPDRLPVGPAMQRAFGAEMARLPHGTQTALLFAAADESGELETLVRALRLRGLGPLELEPAETAGLVVLGPVHVEFRHPLLRASAYQRASAPARRDAHAALAEALLLPPHRRARRAWHLAAATLEPDEQIAAELEAAATHAAQRGAPEAAGRALEAAARLSPDARLSVQRGLAAARSYHLAGTSAPALRLLDAALQGLDDPLVRADIQHTRAQIQGLRGSPAEVRTLLIAEAARVEPHDRRRAVGMLLEAAMASTMLGEPRESLRLAERSSAMAEQLGGGLSVMAGLQLGLARIMCGDAQGLPLLEQARPLLYGSDLSLWGYLGPTVAMADLWVGRYEDARSALVEVIARERELGALTALPWGLHVLAVVEYFLGDWPAAQALATESVALAEEIGQPVVVGLSSVTLAFVAAGRGQFAGAREYAREAVSVVDECGVGSLRTAAGWAQGMIALAEGHNEEAVAVLADTGRFTLDRGLEEPGVILWAQDLAEAYIRSGRSADADATLQVLERQAARTGHPLGHAGASRCRGLLADDDFVAHFQRALAWHDRVPVPFERARTELCFGERLRRERRRSEAREPLRRALAGFQLLGAEPWADRARREIGATGERARRRVPSTADQLTPQELQVARLVAEGSSNKEAASALFVTPKTIETHLGHTYRKLGIRSRVELARSLRESSATKAEG